MPNSEVSEIAAALKEHVEDDAYRAFEDADEIFGSLEDAYFAESIRESAFEDYLDDFGELKTVGGKAA